MSRPPKWAIDAANKRQQQRDDLRRRGFGLPAARDLADIMDGIERRRRRAERRAFAADNDSTAENVAACLLIAALLIIAFLF